MIVAVMWGFCIHLVVHIIQSIIVRGYVPGVATAVMLMPYSAYVVVDMTEQFPLDINVICAICGVLVVAVNLVVMHWVMKR